MKLVYALKGQTHSKHKKNKLYLVLFFKNFKSLVTLTFLRCKTTV